MFKQYRRTQIAELRPIGFSDIAQFQTYGYLTAQVDDGDGYGTEIEISISGEDLKNGSPQIGDMIARNPNNHLDQWLVAAKYFNDNFEECQ